MKVKTASFTMLQGSQVITNLKIPGAIPVFAEGQTVKFTIGANGQLKGPGFSIKFLSANSTENSFSSPSLTPTSLAASGIVEKTNNQPTQTSLSFSIVTFPGTISTTTYVDYTFE